MRWLLYGAYGYTGRLIAERARGLGLRPVLAGRDRSATKALADQLGFEHRSFRLDDPDAVGAHLDGIDAVLHSAGPYSRTFEPMVQGCLSRGCHYLDITGEIDVFERAHALDAQARAAGILILPGVGFDVVPTDCAAVRAARLVESPTHLDLAFVGASRPSRGTFKTMLEGAGQGARFRRDGKIVSQPAGTVTRTLPFSDKERPGTCIPWGDVSTAYHSTGIPNVRVFIRLAASDAKRLSRAQQLFDIPFLRRLMEWGVDRTVRGPTEEERRAGRTRVWCEARNTAGEMATVELMIPNAYAFTALSAAAAMERVIAGLVSGDGIGFMTPSRAFGADFVDGLPGVEWTIPGRLGSRSGT